MKSSLNRNSPWLAKWLPLFRQEENPVVYKEIDATKLKDICNPFDSPCAEDNKSRFHRAFMYIKASALEENIILKTIPDSPSGELEIIFINLKIMGSIKINFSLLKNIEFVNNVFYGDAYIQVIGAIDTNVTFTKNKFFKCFSFNVVDSLVILIENNDIAHRMDMQFNFTPLSNDSNDRKITRKLRGTQLTELHINFFKNKINHLNIIDVNDPLVWRMKEHDYPLEKITFGGDNHIRMLGINTKHTALTSYAPLKIDVARISFNSSDKIGTSIPNPDPTYDDINYHSLLDDKHQLAYGQFFSLLETQMSKQRDWVNEDIYRRKARYFYKKLAPSRADRFIFTWTDWVSKDGTSWRRPLLLLAITETSLATIAYYFLGWDLNYSMEEGWRIFVTLFSWFMNPASLLPLPTPSDVISNTMKTFSESWLIYLLFLFQKLFAAVFYYEIIKVLRRFTK